MNRFLNLTCVAALLLTSFDAAALGNPIAGQEKATLCTECHAADGNNPDPTVPKLTGQMPDYLFKQMLEFSSGHRKSHVMSNMIQSVETTDDLTDIAAYYASLPVMSGSGKRSELGKQGEALFLQERCMYCHNYGGRPDKSFTGGAPVIGGQNKAYLMKVLKDIRAGERKADIHDLMKKTLAAQSDQHIEAIAEYLSSVK